MIFVLIIKILWGIYRCSKGIFVYNIYLDIIYIKIWGILINLIEILIGRFRVKL